MFFEVNDAFVGVEGLLEVDVAVGEVGEGGGSVVVGIEELDFVEGEGGVGVGGDEDAAGEVAANGDKVDLGGGTMEGFADFG